MKVDYINKTNGTDKDYYMMVIDDKGRIHFANSFLVSNLGLRQERIINTDFFHLLDDSHLNYFKKTLRKVKESNESHQLELVARNGSVHWIKWEIERYASDDDNKFFCVGYDIAGKRKIEKLQQVAKEHYESIMEGLNIGVILQDNKGEVLAANTKIAQIFESDAEKLYDINEFEKLWKTVWKEGKQISFDESPSMKALRTGLIESKCRITLRTNTGKLKSILVNSQPLFEENQTIPMSVVTSFIDITREDELEKEVQQQEILFHTFNDHSPNLAWMVNEDACLIYANTSFLKYLGLSDTAIGKNILELVPAILAETFECKHREILETGLTKGFQEKAFLADGSEMIFWINLFPVETITGKKMVGGQAINITDRFAAEKKLSQLNERLQYLSHITTDAIWQWDMQTGQVYRNQILQDIIGSPLHYSSNLGWWFRRVHPEDRRRLRDTIKNIIKSKGQSWESEYRFKKISGEYIIVYDRGYIIYENELPIKMIGSLHDITQVKELEAKLVEEKIQHQRNITETIFTVQEKERTKIGHELHDNVNQLLGTSKMFLDIITTASEEDQELKGKVTEYILSAIEEIRRLSKEMVTPQLKEKGLVESIKTLVADLKATQSMQVVFHHQDEVEILSSTKKVNLFRIVQEQVKNTLKYSNACNLSIDIYIKDKNAVLEIQDDGIGFDSNQTSRGIGLSNIYERTNFYQGTVKIETAPGQGCKLTVTIPVLN